MRKAIFSILFVVVLLAVAVSAEAQQPGKIPRIGYPTVRRPAEKGRSYGSTEALSDLWKGAGLTDIEITGLTMPCQISSFDELWQRSLTGEGPGGAYVLGLQEERREALRQQWRKDVLRGGADGPFTLQAKAWAVRGVVP